MGICFELLVEDTDFPAVLRSILMVGFLGAFTTFSTFSIQVLGLLETGRIVSALIYVIASVCLSLLAVVFGIFICRELTT
jgi:CrcB protein